MLASDSRDPEHSPRPLGHNKNTVPVGTRFLLSLSESHGSKHENRHPRKTKSLLTHSLFARLEVWVRHVDGGDQWPSHGDRGLLTCRDHVALRRAGIMVGK